MDYNKIQLSLFNKQLNKVGIDIITNTSTFKGVFKENNDIDSNKDIKYLLTLESLNLGEIVEISGVKYIVVKKIDSNTVYNNYLLYKCNISIKFNISNNIMGFEGFIDSNSIKLQENKYISMDESIFTLVIPYSNINFTDKRFIKWNDAFKITSIDYTKQGLLYLRVENDVTSSNDDLENEIADRWSTENPKPNYTFDIPTSISVNVEGESTLIYSIKNNGVDVVNPNVELSIGNINIATITEDKVKGVTEGNTTLNMLFHGLDKDYSFNIDIVVTEPVPVEPTYTYTVTSVDGTFNIEQYSANIFTCNRYADGVLSPVTYNITVNRNGLSTGEVIIEDTTSNSIRVRNYSDVGKTIYVKFVDTERGVETVKEVSLIAY